MSSESSETLITVVGAIIANFVIEVAKFVAAVFTGSSLMHSERIHSLADTGNQALLLLGVNLCKRLADETHPFGHGKELYF
jgi:divalent metal cation (Fe/Co/Zn/Cd) transporter